MLLARYKIDTTQPLCFVLSNFWIKSDELGAIQYIKSQYPELIEKLNQNEKEPIFNNSVISKYINTCRYCGIDIPKINNRYCVTSLPFGLDVTQKDVELLEEIQDFARMLLPTKTNKYLKMFISKINKHSNKQISKIS